MITHCGARGTQIISSGRFFVVGSISRNGTERNAGLFHGTDKCDYGTINLGGVHKQVLSHLTSF